MKIKFTNGNGDEADINIKGKCKITDYDTRTKLPDGKDLTVEVDGENVSIMNGTELKQDSQTVEMNANKYSIFTAIAGMDGDGSNLTEKDIAKAKKVFKKGGESCDTLLNLGVTEIRYDSHAGVATIVIGEKELLRIDFQTWRERIGLTKNSTNLPIDTQGTNESDESAENITEVQKPELELHKNAISKLTEKLNMSEEEINRKISEIAENVGCTTTLVKHLMVTESFIRSAKNIGDGVITVGFGHTTNTAHNNKFSAGFKISNDQAFKWLEQDIKDKIASAKECLSDYSWDEVPQSIQDAIIDATFNRGDSILRKDGVTGELKAFLNEGRSKDIDAAISTRQIYKNPRTKIQAGVMKRNCYRFLLAIEDLSASDKLEAMKRFDSNYPYLTKTIELLKKHKFFSAANILKQDWLAVQRAAEKELGYPIEEEETQQNTMYEIKAGDNLLTIAKCFGTTVDKLKEINKLKNDNIVAGKKLIIPPPEQKQI